MSDYGHTVGDARKRVAGETWPLLEGLFDSIGHNGGGEPAAYLVGWITRWLFERCVPDMEAA